MILSTYEQFAMINNELVVYLNELVNNNFDGHTDEEIINKINETLNSVEQLKIESDNIEYSGLDNEKINNLRYSIMNALFLLSDLSHFYRMKELERFKMRAVNYINHNTRAQYFR